KLGWEERARLLEAGGGGGPDPLGASVEEKDRVFVVVEDGPRRAPPPRHPGMAGQRPVLGLREFEPPPQGRQRGCQRRGAKPVERQGRAGPFHRIVPY